MLPNRMQLNRVVEDQLKKLKSYSGITPNIASRIAFFKSIESGYIFHESFEYKLDGSLVLDKFTWLGKSQLITELLLKTKYPKYTDKQLQAAWASHIEHGISSLRNHKSVLGFFDTL
jgi:DNA sulfur modification protein DndE